MKKYYQTKKREHERGEKTNIKKIREMKNKGQQITRMPKEKSE